MHYATTSFIQTAIYIQFYYTFYESSLMCKIMNMKSKVLFLTLMFIWTCQCNKFDMARIVSGKNVKFENWKNWKFTVAIYKANQATMTNFFAELKYASTGVIINKWHVLTVAHSLISVGNSNEIYILSGATDIEYEFNTLLLDAKYYAKNGLRLGKMYRKPRIHMHVSHQLYFMRGLNFLEVFISM